MALSDRLQRRLVLLLAAASLACATAPRSGEEVHIAEESAIIIWDAASKTQHFIRRATFDTAAKDFGFLVPTPAIPSLAEVSDAAFLMLRMLTEPPAARAERSRGPDRAVAAAASPPSVQVIARQNVAGLDAAILKANDAAALDGWLKANGYQSSPALLDWYKPYLEKQWIITAFKIAGGTAQRIDASAVRMSFKTEQPFFPYREPESSPGDRKRALHVYYLGDFRPEGKLGSSGSWPGRLVWSGDLPGEALYDLRKHLALPEPVPKAAARLTRFIDNSSPRPGKEDLYFSPSSDQSAFRARAGFDLERESHWLADYLFGISLLAVVLALVAGDFWFRRARAKSKTRQDPTSAPPSA